jgi:hypothetical protein
MKAELEFKTSPHDAIQAEEMCVVKQRRNQKNKNWKKKEKIHMRKNSYHLDSYISFSESSIK